MLKVLALLVVLAISANAQQNFFYSPYSQKLVPLTASNVPNMAVKRDNTPLLPVETKRGMLDTRMSMPVETKREMMDTRMSMPVETKREMLDTRMSMPVETKREMMDTRMSMPVETKREMMDTRMSNMPIVPNMAVRDMPIVPNMAVRDMPTTNVPVKREQTVQPLPTVLPFTQRVPELTVFRENFCQGMEPESKLPFPDNANKFIVCHLEGAFDIMSCPRHTVFNVHSQQCETSLRKPKGCSSNPCQNAARCVDLPFSQFTCECPAGFTGRMCETRTTCTTGGMECGPRGVCMQLPVGSPADHFCLCDEGMTYGLTCNARDVQQNPCVSNEADHHSFPVPSNKALFLQCDGHIPHLKFCAYPLVYSQESFMCNWE